MTPEGTASSSIVPPAPRQSWQRTVVLDRLGPTHDIRRRMFLLRAFQTANAPVPSERWQFPQLPIRVGRSPENDYAPQHPAISSFHACIEEIAGRICIRDLGSSNGVYVIPTTGGEPLRIEPNVPVDLAPAGYRFFLSPSVWVQLDIVPDHQPSLDHGSSHPSHVAGQGPTVPVQQFVPITAAPAAPEAPLPAWNASPPRVPVGSAATGSPVPGSHDDSPKSQFLKVDLDFLALQGLRELSRSLIPGRPLETTGDVARLITKLHDTVDVFCRAFIPLRQGYEQFVSTLDVAAKRSMNLSPTAAALEVATTPEAVAQVLLDPRDHSSDGPRAAERILSDLVQHQIALLDGVMQGVRSLLDELSPEKIDEALNERGTPDLFGSKYRARWTEFCERYERLSDERETLAVLFGKDFAEVYRQYWQRGDSKEDASRRGGA